MTAEATAVPLNLLGGPGDVPDFVVSTQVLSYVFTLRGEKNWKQPPGTSGAGSVSPLALKVYEALVAGNALTARELVSELGREVTESAIVRALGELWMQLRVIPLLQQDGTGAKDSGTMWELTTRRFTKQIKAGANAGQPTALSAAISLYLAQVYAATEEEIETFLSPLTARSKVRDVLHGLTAARQLENAVLEGKTLLYIPGALPEFPEVVAAEPLAGVGDIAAAAVGAVAGIVGAIAGAARIRKFDGPRTPRAPREDRGERPFRKTGGERGGPRKTLGERKPYERSGGRTGGRSESGGSGDRERRPFQRDRAAGARPSFTRPWDEDRKPRPQGEEGERPAPARERTYRKDDARGAGAKREFRGGPRKPGSDRGAREERPFRPRREGEREGSGSRPAKPFRPRAEGESKPSRPRREGEREGFAARPSRPYKPRGEGDRAGFGARPAKPFRPRSEGDSKPFRPRREGEGEGSASRPTRPYKPRGEGDRAGYSSRESKPFRPRREGEREGSASRPSRPYKPRAEGDRATGGKPPFRKREDRPGTAGEGRPGAKRTGAPGFAGKKFGGEKKFGGKPKFGGDRKFSSAGSAGGKSRFGGKPKPKFGSKSGNFKGGKKGGARKSTPSSRPKAEE
jgi:hypothetical protein